MSSSRDHLILDGRIARGGVGSFGNGYVLANYEASGILRSPRSERRYSSIVSIILGQSLVLMVGRLSVGAL